MKTYLITGGTTGIGRTTLKTLHMLKDTVKIINLDISKPNQTFTKEEFIQINLSNLDDVKKLSVCGKLDGIFFNAGVHKYGSIETLDFDDIDFVLNLNLRANIILIKNIIDNLNNDSAIIFNASDQSLIAKPMSFIYGLTKGAIAQMTKSLALDLAYRNIRVNSICPGTIDTPLYQNAIQNYAIQANIKLADAEKEERNLYPLKRIGTAQEVANLVCFLLSDKSKFITGSLIPIDGGYTAQ